MERNKGELFAQELDRQWYALRVRVGTRACEESLSIPFSHFAKGMQRLENGEIQEGLSEVVLARFEVEELAETDSAVALTSAKMSYEATAKGLSPLAGLLVMDAVLAAARGELKEEWIAQVLRGHAGDEDAQKICLREILALWNDGPWPWIKGTESDLLPFTQQPGWR